MNEIYDVIIIGAGPAGLTAGLYTSRAKLHTIIIEKELIGGELLNRDLIDNFPSYPDGIQGPLLGSKMADQTMKYGAEIQLAEAMRVSVEGSLKTIETTAGSVQGKVLIIAGGAHPKKLGILGEKELTDKGVFYCATCDGTKFANKVVAVAGAGNSGVAEGLFLTNFVSQVILLEALAYSTAIPILLDKALRNPKISMRYGVKIDVIHGSDKVKSVDIIDIKSGQRSTLKVDGVLVHVGVEPNTDYLKNVIPLDEHHQIMIGVGMETKSSGIFAAGDIRQLSPGQIVTAAGDGAAAAISAQWYLGTL